MKTPHTHFRRGKRVFLILRDGRRITDKFVERTARHVVLENHKIQTAQLRSMSFHRWDTANEGRLDAALEKLTASGDEAKGEEMIYYVVGDATEPQGAGNKIIMHICNDAGAWGKGFVLAVSERWPQPEAIYRMTFRDQAATVSKPQRGHVQFVPVTDAITVANMVAQQGYGGKIDRVDKVALAACLHQVAQEARLRRASVHAPYIGCGLGGSTWETIRPIVEKAFIGTDVPVLIYSLPGKETPHVH